MFGALTILLTAVVLGFTIQVADLYVIRLQAQRAADLAAMAAAVGSSAPVISSGAASTSAIATALNVASVNGFGSSTVTTTGAVAGGGTYTVSSVISNQPAALMGNWVGGVTPVVKASGHVLMTAVVVSDCIAALSGSVQISGSATLAASGCGLAAQSTIGMSGGSFTASSAAVGVHQYDEMPQITGGSASPGTSSFIYNASTPDTVAGNASVVAAKSHLLSLSSWPYGSTIPQTVMNPSVTAGSAENVSAATVSVPAQTHAGAVTLSRATVNFVGSGAADPTCAKATTISGTTTLSGANTLNFASGCYVFAGAISTDSSASNNAFNVNTNASVTFVFEGAINQNTTGTMSFGNASSFSFGGALTVSAAGYLTVGTGTKAFAGEIKQGPGNITFGNGASYLNGVTVLGQTGTTSFGTGPFYIWNGSINNTSTGTLYFAYGPFYFYNTTVTNGAGDGSLEFDGGGYYFYNSSVVLGANSYSYTRFAQSNMDFYDGGSISINGGGVIIGGYAGDYNQGSNVTGGAAISLYGGSFTVSGTGYVGAWGVTLALTTGSVNIEAGTFNAAAPSSATPTYGDQNLLILSTAGAVNFSGGASQVSGMIYAPASTVAISGAATLAQNQSASLCIAAANVTLAGTSSISPLPCTGIMPTTTGNAAALSQ